jgi:predicted phosphodiesterase
MSPRKVNEYLLEDRPSRSFERIAQLADCDVLLFGHTHKPWASEYGGVSVSIERVEYDTRAVAREIQNMELPQELAEQLVQGA